MLCTAGYFGDPLWVFMTVQEMDLDRSASAGADLASTLSNVRLGGSGARGADTWNMRDASEDDSMEL